MYKLFIDKLKCIKPDDPTEDECRLDIYVDGSLFRTLKKSMKKSNTWEINQSIYFNHFVQITLTDEDNVKDDFLGAHMIPAVELAHSSYKFQLDNADYTLWLKVTIETGVIDPIEEAITEFENSPVPDKMWWKNIAKADLIADMRDKIKHPHHVSQNNYNLCGPAVIVYELAKRSKLRYVDFCRKLYETNAYTSRDITVTASATLLNSNFSSDISPADWMLMTALRETENDVFEIDENMSGLAALTPSYDIETWTKNILCFNSVEEINCNIIQDIKALREARNVVSRGGVAFLLNNSRLVGNTNPSAEHLPTHWVSLLGGVKIDLKNKLDLGDGIIEFRCYTWGKEEKYVVNEGDFRKHFYGAVTGE